MIIARFCAVLVFSAAFCTTAAASDSTEIAATAITFACLFGSGQASIDACTGIIDGAKNGPDASSKGIAPVYVARAQAYAGKKMFGPAMADFAKAVRLDPGSTRTFYLRGLTHLNDMKRFDLAVQDFTEAVRVDATNEPAFVDRGMAYLNLGQYERAAADFGTAMRLDPKSGTAATDRGWANDLLGRRDLAIRDYDEAVRRMPNYASAYSQRCLSKLSMGQNPKTALGDCNKALAVKQTDDFFNAPRGALFASRALFFALTGNADAARKDCASGRAADANITGPEKNYMIYFCGLVETKTGDVARGNADIAAAAKVLYPADMRLFAGYGMPPSGPAAYGTARLELVLLADDPATATGAMLRDFHDPHKTYLVARDITLPGDIASANAVVDSVGRPTLELYFSAGAATRTGDASLVGHQIALVLDGRTALAEATLQSPLIGGASLTGNFTIAEIRKLVAAIYPPAPADSFLVWMERFGGWYLVAAFLLIALGVGAGRLLPRRA